MREPILPEDQYAETPSFSLKKRWDAWWHLFRWGKTSAWSKAVTNLDLGHALWLDKKGVSAKEVPHYPVNYPVNYPGLKAGACRTRHPGGLGGSIF